MALRHWIDRNKVVLELKKRGWYLNELGHWETRIHKTEKRSSEDFYQAFEASIVCEETEEKLGTENSSS
jgi:hypothetical protein